MFHRVKNEVPEKALCNVPFRHFSCRRKTAFGTRCALRSPPRNFRPLLRRSRNARVSYSTVMALQGQASTQAPQLTQESSVT